MANSLARSSKHRAVPSLKTFRWVKPSMAFCMPYVCTTKTQKVSKALTLIQISPEASSCHAEGQGYMTQAWLQTLSLKRY
jgi:hypothetical protein